MKTGSHLELQLGVRDPLTAKSECPLVPMHNTWKAGPLDPAEKHKYSPRKKFLSPVSPTQGDPRLPEGTLAQQGASVNTHGTSPYSAPQLSIKSCFSHFQVQCARTGIGGQAWNVYQPRIAYCSSNLGTKQGTRSPECKLGWEGLGRLWKESSGLAVLVRKAPGGRQAELPQAAPPGTVHMPQM